MGNVTDGILTKVKTWQLCRAEGEESGENSHRCRHHKRLLLNTCSHVFHCYTDNSCFKGGCAAGFW